MEKITITNTSTSSTAIPNIKLSGTGSIEIAFSAPPEESRKYWQTEICSPSFYEQIVRDFAKYLIGHVAGRNGSFVKEWITGCIDSFLEERKKDAAEDFMIKETCACGKSIACKDCMDYEDCKSYIKE